MKRFRVFAVMFLAMAFFFIFFNTASAANGPDVFHTILTKYQTVMSGWLSVIRSGAMRLFWTLATIGLVWNGADLIIKRGEVGDFFAMFMKWLVVTGFFWWLLFNSVAISQAVVDGLKQMAGLASGTSANVDMGQLVENGCTMFGNAVDHMSTMHPVTDILSVALALAALALQALMAVDYLIGMIKAFMMEYAGLVILGFGGCDWTRDVAKKYFWEVISLGLNLFSLILLISVATTIMQGYNDQIQPGMTYEQMVAYILALFILYKLVHQVPPMLGGLVGSAGGAGGMSTAVFAGMVASMVVASLASGGLAVAGKGVKKLGNLAGLGGGGGAGGDSGGEGDASGQKEKKSALPDPPKFDVNSLGGKE